MGLLTKNKTRSNDKLICGLRMRVKSHLLVLAVLTGIWVHTIFAEPSQCTQLKVVIPQCSCVSALIDNVPNDSLVVINCSGKEMSHVPNITGSSEHVIYEMTLTNNNITSLPDSAFQGLRIQRLDLRNNWLTNISLYAFRGLERDLQELWLSSKVGVKSTTLIPSLVNVTSMYSLYLENFRFSIEGELLRNDTLWTLVNLKELTLRNNSLLYLDDRSLPTELTALELDFQALEAMPVNLFEHLTALKTLRIRNTKNVTIIWQKAFLYNKNLMQLDLSHNQITTLTTGCFIGVTDKLQELILSNNPIKNVMELDPIADLTALKSLELSNIGLTILLTETRFLQNKQNLTTLYLEQNQITALGASTFAVVGNSLTTLSLAKNQIANMDLQAFAGLTMLKSLNLSFQMMGSSQQLFMPVLPSALEELVLSGTPLNQESLWSKVHTLTELRILKLDDTELLTLEDNALLSLEHLKELYLQNNKISQVNQKKFAGPRSLTKLDLSSNNINSIDSCTFYQYVLRPSLELDLTGNALHCDCTLRWLLEENEAGKIKLSGSEKCRTPSDKANKFLTLIPAINLTCVFQWTPEPCQDSTTTPTELTTIQSTTSKPILSVSITDLTDITITVRWSVTNIPSILDHFVVKATNVDTNSVFVSSKIKKSQDTYSIRNLTSGTRYTVCVIATNSLDQELATKCTVNTTLNSANVTPENRSGNEENVGIIVGSVVGGVVILVLLAAILYLVFRRQAPKKPDNSQQPHVLFPSDLPTRGTETRTFNRQKDKKPKVGRALDQKLSIISDGQTENVSDCHSAGNYKYMDQKYPAPQPSPNPESVSQYPYKSALKESPIQDNRNAGIGYLNIGFNQDGDGHA